MKAIIRHEVYMYFHSLTAYIFGAFLLLFMGIGAMIYNINQSMANFELVIYPISIAFIIIIPILTMRVFAEERKQKTDQLLFSLPISTYEMVFGKYIALLVVFALPLLVSCFYPLIFKLFGNVYLPTAYGAIFAYFLVGASLIAIGMFISSLTESQGLAAGLCVVVMLICYFMTAIAGFLTTSALASMIVICVFIALLALIVKLVTGNNDISFYGGVGLIVVVAVLYFIKEKWFEGLVPNILNKLSLFARLDTFVNGVFDIGGVVYFLGIAAIFLFFCVQSLEKRRYS